MHRRPAILAANIFPNSHLTAVNETHTPGAMFPRMNLHSDNRRKSSWAIHSVSTKSGLASFILPGTALISGIFSILGNIANVDDARMVGAGYLVVRNVDLCSVHRCLSGILGKACCDTACLRPSAMPKKALVQYLGPRF
jgi:hypothetical protein